MAKGKKKDVTLTRFLRGGHSDDGKLVQAVFGGDDGNEYTLTATPKTIDRMTASLQELKLMARGAAADADGPLGSKGETSMVRFMPRSGGKHIVMEVRDPKGRVRQFPLNQIGFKSVVQGLKTVREIVERYRRMKDRDKSETGSSGNQDA